MNLIDNSGWYALVKYKSGNETEVLPILKIQLKIGTSERVSFNPKSLTDFDRMKFYTVNTTHGSKDGREHKWYAHIGLLAESRKVLENAMVKKRKRWPIVLSDGDDGDQSEPNSTDNDNAVLEEGNLTITSNRDSNTKKQATDAVHAQLLASRSLYESSTTHAPVTEDDDITCLLLRENAELKSALQAEQKKNIPGEVRKDQNIANILQECLQSIEAKVEKIQDQFQKQLDSVGQANMEKLAELEGKMTKIEDWMSKFPQPYPQYVQHWLNSLPENENIEYLSY
ncbi:uncharacterized protein [Temnothorax longispinosus]|uniref:uncharacterized protein n=1 Tax=Temnothorax longispinosus TaxID=300112 RepID=UPI003A990120